MYTVQQHIVKQQQQQQNRTIVKPIFSSLAVRNTKTHDILYYAKQLILSNGTRRRVLSVKEFENIIIILSGKYTSSERRLIHGATNKTKSRCLPGQRQTLFSKVLIKILNTNFDCKLIIFFF